MKANELIDYVKEVVAYRYYHNKIKFFNPDKDKDSNDMISTYKEIVERIHTRKIKPRRTDITGKDELAKVLSFEAYNCPCKGCDGICFDQKSTCENYFSTGWYYVKRADSTKGPIPIVHCTYGVADPNFYDAMYKSHRKRNKGSS